MHGDGFRDATAADVLGLKTDHRTREFRLVCLNFASWVHNDITNRQ